MEPLDSNTTIITKLKKNLNKIKDLF